MSRRYITHTSSLTSTESSQTKSAQKIAVEIAEYTGSNLERAISRAHEYVMFCNENMRHPRQAATDLSEKALAQWAFNYRRGVAGTFHIKARPEVNTILDQAPLWRDLRAATAMQTKVSAIQDFIARNDTPPSGQLGAWLSRQRKHANGEAVGTSADGHRDYVLQLDETWGHIWRDEDEFRYHCIGRKIIRVKNNNGGKLPAKTYPNENNLLSGIRTRMRHDRGNKKFKVFESFVRMMYNEAPGTLPTSDECVDKFKFQ